METLGRACGALGLSAHVFPQMLGEECQTRGADERASGRSRESHVLASESMCAEKRAVRV